MVLTQETDYALRIVYCLSKSGHRMDAASISREMCVTMRFALKILGKLAAAGIVVGHKGVGGGYELARSPAEIDLKQVIDAIEGSSYSISRCLMPGKDCSRGAEGYCSIRRIFAGINDSVNKKLSSVTFADILSGEKT